MRSKHFAGRRHPKVAVAVIMVALLSGCATSNRSSHSVHRSSSSESSSSYVYNDNRQQNYYNSTSGGGSRSSRSVSSRSTHQTVRRSDGYLSEQTLVERNLAEIEQLYQNLQYDQIPSVAARVTYSAKATKEQIAEAYLYTAACSYIGDDRKQAAAFIRKAVMRAPDKGPNTHLFTTDFIEMYWEVHRSVHKGR